MTEQKCCDLQLWPLTRVLTEVRCGSQDWTWEEEWANLDRRHAETGYLTTLEQQIRENGITMPVLIGSDGRLWDGHHRLRLAVRLGIDYVPVEVVAGIRDAARTAAARQTTGQDDTEACVCGHEKVGHGSLDFGPVRCLNCLCTAYTPAVGQPAEAHDTDRAAVLDEAAAELEKTMGKTWASRALRRMAEGARS